MWVGITFNCHNTTFWGVCGQCLMAHFLIPEVSLFGHDEMRLPIGPFLNPSANPLGKIANPTHLIGRSLAYSE